MMRTLIIAFFAAAFCIGCSSPSPTGKRLARRDAEAVVLRCTGRPICSRYESEHEITYALKRGMKIPLGAKIMTDANSRVWLSINGQQSTVLIEPSSEVRPILEKGTGSCMLDVRAGEISVKLKKIEPDDRFEILTPRGVAGTRDEASFRFNTERLGVSSSGPWRVTFSCQAGTLYVTKSVSVAGVQDFVAIHAGQQYVVCDISGREKSVVVESPSTRQKL